LKTENQKLKIEIFFSLSNPATTTKNYLFIYLFIYFLFFHVYTDSTGEGGRGGRGGEGREGEGRERRPRGRTLFYLR
jgi:hypothetical protein